MLSEALVSSLPVIASRIPGLMGTLGSTYPGYFPLGDTRALARLLAKSESDPKFHLRLRQSCARVAPLVDPRREAKSWSLLIKELSRR